MINHILSMYSNDLGIPCPVCIYMYMYTWYFLSYGNIAVKLHIICYQQL